MDFEFYGGLVGLTACCLYGGSPYASQNQALQRGVDIIVGTPERIKVCILLFVYHHFFMGFNFLNPD